MRCEPITYHDLDGNEYTEKFYFNLNESEIVKMQLSEEGGLTEMIERIIAAKDQRSIHQIFERIIRAAYGVKSVNGKYLIKNDEVWQEFYQSDAYNQLFMKIAFDPEAAAKFIEGIIAPNSAVSSEAVAVALGTATPINA